MFRLLKALPLTLALASLGFFATSCGSSSQSQIRVVNAISDSVSSGLDVEVNSTKDFTALTFTGVQPTPPAYTKVPSGSVTVEVFDTGTTTNPIINSTGVGLSGSKQYTEVLSGFNSAASLLSIPDDNSAPATGNIKVRVIHSSSSNQTAFDIYILPSGADPTQVSADISSLTYQQAAYVTKVNPTNGYFVWVTASGNKSPLNGYPFFYAFPNDSIRTLVLVDIPPGVGLSPTPVVLNDLK